MDSKALVRPIHEFALDFANNLEKKTCVCSPVSAEIALALIALASTNETHDELVQTLCFADDAAIRASFSFFTPLLNDLKDTLNVATKICLRKGDYDLKAPVKKDAEEVFQADIEQLNFGDAEAAADHINKWAAVQTNDKITNIITAGEFSDAQILLLNAIYFKGAWLKPFKRHLTENRTFHVNSETDTEVPMMTVTDTFRYAHVENLYAQILELQYTKEGTSMVIVLPDEVEGLVDVMEWITSGQDLLADIEGLGSRMVQVSLPKFKAETTIDLKKLLPKMGIKKIFEKNSAGIELLNTTERFSVSSAIQKAVIEVNEEGTEAAAVTKMKLIKKKGIPNPTYFTADRPFLFLLFCKGVPVFVGTYRGEA